MHEHAAVVPERSNEFSENHRVKKRIFSGVVRRGDRWLTNAGDRPSENFLSSAFLYCGVRSNLRESDEIIWGKYVRGLLDDIINDVFEIGEKAVNRIS